MNIAPIERINDWEKRLERQDAFWDRQMIDRPVVHIAVPLKNPQYPYPKKKHTTLRDRWMDVDYQAESALSHVMNTEYLGDALPSAFPNLGPEVFSAYFGCELEYSESTSWSIPNLKDWADADKIRFSKDNPYWKKTIELTNAFVEVGKGKFYTGFTDLHPGGDAIVAFRDPQELNMDLLECPENITSLLRHVTDTYFQIYDFYHNLLLSTNQAITNWTEIVSTRKWYVPSNDFSCMISKRMFDEVFLPGIAEECGYMDASVYHLDGPGALRHLDSLLEIEKLNAIQWVYGAGNGRASDWMDIYKKCQDAGKGLQMHMYSGELDFFMENLKPEGLWIFIDEVESREHAESLLKKVENWKRI